MACLALILLFFSPAGAWQKSRESKPARKSASKKSAPAESAPKSKKTDDEDDAADERHKLSDLKSEQALPHLQDLAVPTVEQLHKSPVDWIVLKGFGKGNGLVVVVKQVFPRPDTLKKLQTALDELRRQPPPTTQAEREKRTAQRNDLSKLVVMLPGEAEGQLYEIPTNVIDSIVYHEDLIIRRAAMLIDGGRFRDAFELLCPLARQTPGWKGLKDQTQRLVFLEGQRALQSGDLESALTSLEELHVQNRDYPLLQTRLGEVVDKLIVKSRTAGNFRESRHFLGRLSRIEPQHEIVQKWTGALADEAQKLIEAADAAGRAGRHEEAVTLVDRAARVWPKAPGLGDLHRKLTARYQRLAVGVQSLPLHSVGEATRFPVETLADYRARRLTQFDLFEVDRIDDTTHYRSRLIEQWEPTDLGRRAVFTLKSTRSHWESRPILTSTALLSTMESLLDPASPSFDERFANSIDSLHLRSPFEFEVRFSHAPPRTELLFRFPVTAPGGAAEGMGFSARTGSGPGRILSRRFERVHGTDRETVYRRVIPEPDGLAEYHVAEVVERRYDSPEQAIQGLMRGEISLLPDLPTWAVSLVANDPRFFVLHYAVPTTHVLQINPRSAPLRSRELRLAMAYSIDAPQLLSRVVLRDPTLQNGRVVTAPFATTSYAYNSLVAPRDFNAGMAASLYAAAAKRLKSVPVLRMVCEPGPTAHLAAAEILNEWKRVGIRAELVTGDASAAGGAKWDVAYRTLRMEEPLVELWPFLTVDAGPRLESLRNLPDWLREEMLGLDNAADWKSAVSRLQQLQGHLYAEVECIPLWEIDDALVLRKNIRDFPPVKFVHAYQDVERWIVQSWFPEDEP